MAAVCFHNVCFHYVLPIKLCFVLSYSAASLAAATSSGQSFVPPSNEVFDVILPPVLLQINSDEVSRSECECE